MKVYSSQGWKRPYCYTIKDDIHNLNDKQSIIDGGFFHYRVRDKQKYIEDLATTNVDFIIGFDSCPKCDALKYQKYLIREGKDICPIIHNLQEFNELELDVERIATHSLDVLKSNNTYKIHWLGEAPNQHLEKISTIDFNPYQNNKYYLLRMLKTCKQLPIKIPHNILKLGEFILYGSSLFINNPNDYDLLYYGDSSDEELQKIQIPNKKLNIVKVTDEILNSGRITHVLFAVDNGISLTDCPNIQNLYEQAKQKIHSIKSKVCSNKCWVSFNYMRDFETIKEFKTLLISNYYLYNNGLTNYLYQNLHLVYRSLQNDVKASMLLNRNLYSKFNKTLKIEKQERNQMYKNHKIISAYDTFFKTYEENERYEDAEEIHIKL